MLCCAAIQLQLVPNSLDLNKPVSNDASMASFVSLSKDSNVRSYERIYFSYCISPSVMVWINKVYDPIET